MESITLRTFMIGAALLALAAGSGCGGGGGGGTPANQIPIAHAGPDQAVVPSGAVTLTGSGTDSDGTIVSYSWTQTAGTAVTLAGATAATATFTAPATTGSLSFSLVVTDNRGGASVADMVVVDAQTATVVSGHVTFDFVPFHSLPATGLDYASIAARPARGVVVEAIDAASGTMILASTDTDAAGAYSLTLAPGLNVFLRVKAEMRKTASGGSPSSWDFRVRDNTNGNALYALDGANFNSSTGGAHDLRAPLAFAGNSYTDRRAAPFAVLDTVYQAFNLPLAADPTMVFPPLSLFWSAANHAEAPSGTCSVAQGCISITHYETGPAEGIYIQGQQNDDTDEYDTHVIVHEWGHYFQDKFSRDDSIGGSHFLGDRLDARVAFSEGWGNALSGMALADPLYRDSSGPQQGAEFNFSVESEATAAPGWFSETSVQDIFYDVFDATADGADALNLGFAPIMAVMRNDVPASDAFSTIFVLARGLKERQPAVAGAIDALLAASLVVGTHPDPSISPDFASAETNNGGDARNLPVYAPITLGSTVVVTSRAFASTDGFTRYNKLGNRRYLVFTLTTARAVTIGVTATGCNSATPTRDPDVILYHRGAVVGTAEDFGCDTLVTPAALAAGTYVIETYEFSNIDPADGSLPAGDTDISVSLN